MYVYFSFVNVFINKVIVFEYVLEASKSSPALLE